jgi:ribokinase
MKIAIAGGYGVGMTMKVDAAPESGETVIGRDLQIVHGGKGSNQAVAARRLGADVSLFSAVGIDEYGVAATAFWSAEGIDAGAVVSVPQPTMTGFILVDSHGENRIAIAPGALATLEPEQTEKFRQQIADADMLIVSLEIPLASAIALLRIARAEGTKTLLNPAPAAAIPAEYWSLVDVLTPNQSEAAALLDNPTDSLTPAELAARLQSLTAAAVVLTAGEQGVAVNDGAAQCVLGVFPVDEVRDTTGAGDAFTAALGVALCEGMSLQQAARFAAAAGALAVTADGVIAALPTRSALEGFLAQHLENRREDS